MEIARIYKTESLGWIGSKNAMQFFPSLLITIAVYTIYVATTNMCDVMT